MAFYNKSGGNRGGGGYGAGRSNFGARNRDEGGERPMFTARCAQCGNECQVPFRPNGTKPVYCNNCFQRDERPRFDATQQHGAFSRPRFDGTGFSGATSSAASAQPDHDKIKIQLAMINSKLDRIMKLVSPVVTIEPIVEDADKAPIKKSKKKAAK